MKKLLVIAFFVLLVSTVYSGSMQAPSIGARATGMGGAFVAVADDPSSLFWNPAGLGLCKGTLYMSGTAFVAPYSYYEVDGADKEKSTTTAQMIPNLFLAHNFTDSFSMGLGYYVPFGLGQRWKDDASLNYNSTRSEISLSNLQAGMSLKLTDDFLIGAGLAEGFAKMNTKSYSIVIPDGGGAPSAAYVKTEGEGRGTSGNIGFLWSPSSYNWTVGGVWRSETNVKFKGEVDIGGAGFTTFDREISMDFTFPQTASIGVSYSGFERWLLSGQVDWVNWSRMDTITQKLDDPVTLWSPVPPPFGTAIITDEIEVSRDWKDRYIFRIGAEYEVTPEFALRGGYMWDPSPVPAETLDPMMFDVSSNRYFVGASFPVWTMKIDVAYAYSQGIKREAEDSENVPPTNGDYWGHSHMFEISTTYTF
ncbi:MAG: outer membrane protein transport protein [Candidatus Omnitrophica bacterium]|nr:outer membrane protein transport protein [Candidatus Omnitrophota bacterium]MBU1048309.1 outer membrane protein transport protein [Candidatus Omnitrophota bacterium]MBU1630276.1 outer membrane protein transport protein [Candidatus Omnitrophota bacterium]MBU1766535.1 outer membrane protein transport protein [Candidatus Omnitrophota bacterium]MBU1889709.1 outer membrane protein transport protein [Candidatus Omnitrophota bacterium]